MLRIIKICVAAFLIALMNFGVAVYADGINAMYDAGKSTVEINGSIGDTQNVPVIVTISPHTAAGDGFSDDNKPLISYMVFTGENGSVYSNKVYENVFSSGLYDIFLTSSEGMVSTDIVIYNPNDKETLAVLDVFNTSENADSLKAYLEIEGNIEKIGFKSDDVKEYISDISEFCIAYRDENKKDYNIDALTDSVRYAIAASQLCSGSDADDVFFAYYDSFKCSYDEYNALDEEMKNEIVKVFEDSSYIEDGTRTTLSELTAVCNVRLSCDSLDALREYLTGSPEVYDIDISENSTYRKIKSTDRHLVFYNILDEISEVTTVNQIKDIFEKSVEDVYDETKTQDKPSSSSGKGKGGSGGATVSYPIVPPEADNSQSDKEAIDDSIQNVTADYSDTYNHFCHDAAYELSQKGILKGYDDGSFRPDNNVTRAEFSAIIYRVLNIDADISSEAMFYDVDPDAWYYESVSALAKNEIVKGYDGFFNPEAYITREDAAVILDRVIDAEGSTDVKFEDENEISDYALESVYNLYSNKIITGYENRFSPKAMLTRGETAVMIYRAYDMLREDVR